MAGGADGAWRRLYRHPADPRSVRRRPVSVPAAVHPRRRRFAVLRFGALVPGAARFHRHRLRSYQQRAQPAHALTHSGAADLSRCAAVREIPGRTIDHHDHVGRAVAHGHWAWHPDARPAARPRGSDARGGDVVRHRGLCRRVAGAGALLLHRLSLGRDRGLGCARPVAFLTILWPLIAPFLAALFVSDTVATPAELLSHLGVMQAFARVSPGALFGEIVGVLLDPTVRSTQQPLLASLGLALVQPGSVPGAPLPLLQSLEVVWPQTVGMIASAILLFVIGYVIFQRQEVRA